MAQRKSHIHGAKPAHPGCLRGETYERSAAQGFATNLNNWATEPLPESYLALREQEHSLTVILNDPRWPETLAWLKRRNPTAYKKLAALQEAVVEEFLGVRMWVKAYAKTSPELRALPETKAADAVLLAFNRSRLAAAIQRCLLPDVTKSLQDTITHARELAVEMASLVAEPKGRETGRKPEETGGAPTTHPAAEKDEHPVETHRDPTPAELRAWQSYGLVCKERPDLMPTEGAKRYTKEMYEEAMQSPTYRDEDTGKQNRKPNFGSWKRNLRGYIQKAPKQEDTRPHIRSEELVDDPDKIDHLSSVQRRRSAKE